MYTILKSKIFHLIVLFILLFTSCYILSEASLNNKKEMVIKSFEEKLVIIKKQNVNKDELYVNYKIIQLIYVNKELVSSPNAYKIPYYFDSSTYKEDEVNYNLGYFVFDQSFLGEQEILYIYYLDSNELSNHDFLYPCYLLMFFLYIIIGGTYWFIDNKNLKFNYKLNKLLANNVVRDPIDTYTEIEDYVMSCKLFEKCISSSYEGLIIFKDNKIVFFNKAASKFINKEELADEYLRNISKTLSDDLIKEEYQKGEATYFIETKKLEVKSFVYYAMYIVDETAKIEFKNNKVNFFNQASHELRTPLTNLSAYVDLLCNCELSAKDKEEMMVEGIDECRKLDVLITSILDISKRLEKDDLYIKVDLEQLIYENLESFKYGKTKYTVTIDGAKHLICNKTKVSNLINNLLSNAFIHNVEGGFVNIELVEHVGLFDLVITNSAKEIKPFEEDKVFEPFFKCQSNTLNSGSGIGLTISKYICDTHNYEIDFKYQENIVTVTTRLYLKSLSRHMKK